MRINFLLNIVFDGWEPTDIRLGGTERGVMEWAEELVKRNHTVFVYRNGSETKHNGVYYLPRELYPGGNGVCINLKSPEIPPDRPTVFYTNDVDADKQDLSAYNAVIHISEWAKNNIPVNNPNVFIVPHGFDDSKLFPSKKNPKQCLYASSPDRGLDTLLRAWPKVKAAHPDAMLLVTYGFHGPEYKGIEYLGDCDEETMDELFRTSDIWCHPANGGELQCISGLKAQATGCWPVIIPTMALSETVKYGTFSTKETYAEDLIGALSGHSEQSYKGTTIKESTDELLKVVEYVKKNAN